MQTDVVNVRGGVGGANPVEHPFVGHQRPGAVPAGEHDDVGGRALLERAVDLDAEHAVVRADHATLVADERHVDVRDALQHLVRADAVERGEVGEERDGDGGHGVTVPIVRSAVERVEPTGQSQPGGAGSLAGVDVRIGVTQAPREINIELADDADRDDLKSRIEAALAGATDVLWITDKRGKDVAVPVGEDRLRRTRLGRRRPQDRLRRLNRRPCARWRRAGHDRRCSTSTCSGSPARAASARPRSPRRSPRSPPVSGRRTLVCEMDAKGALATAFDVDELAFEPTEVAPNLHAMTMNTEDSLREYLRLFVRIPLLGRIGPLAKTFDFVADAAPGVKEILGVGKLCYEVRERHYDLVVVDAEASGHIVSQIGAPKVIADLVQVGLVRDQTQWMLDILDDPARTGVAVVTTPEEMPVTETIELLARLTRRDRRPRRRP